MQLTVPQRNVADTQSFPVDPDEVSRWLANLNPVENTAHAWEVYRGLKHSNRLHNDVDRRRLVISCFIPALRELHSNLSDLCRAQPIPLTREFRRAAKLLDGLLREEAFAFKLLLADSEQPKADDVRRAMMALSRQADARLVGYQNLPTKLLRDANQLYQLAEHHQLLDTAPETALPGGPQSAAIHHYFYIQCLAVIGTRQIRARQLPLVIKFLRDKAVVAKKLRALKPEQLSQNDWGLHLHIGAKPVAAKYLLQSDESRARWFNTQALLNEIDAEIAKIRSNRYSMPGADTLEKQTLARLRMSFVRIRQRRAPRRITNKDCNATLGHKAICAQLSYSNPDKTQDTTLALQQNSKEAWQQCNVGAQGSLLAHNNCGPGLAQVGELVCVNDQNSPSALKARIGIVRWIEQNNDVEIKLGVEYIARGVMPVTVSRYDNRNTEHATIADDGLIVACKLKDKLVQTLLLPAYLYQTGDVIIATQNEQTRTLKLVQSLQNNGLFSHFSLAQVAMD